MNWLVYVAFLFVLTGLLKQLAALQIRQDYWEDYIEPESKYLPNGE